MSGSRLQSRFARVALLLVLLTLSGSPDRSAASASGSCDPLGTPRRQALADGWYDIVFGDDWYPWEVLTVDGKTIRSEDLMAMTQDERVALADQWLLENAISESEIGAIHAACDITSAPSNTLTFDSLDEECQELADDGPGLGWRADMPFVLGCRQLPDGGWIMPRLPSDSRLPPYVGRSFSPPHTESGNAVRNSLAAQIDELPSALTSPSWLAEALETAIDPSTGRPTFPDTGGIGEVRKEYDPALLAYLQDPAHTQLATYAVWYANRRDAVLKCGDLAPMFCDAFLKKWGLGHAPWPWELANPEVIDLFVEWAIDNGYVTADPASQGSASANSSAADCSSVAYWLGATEARMHEAIANMMSFPFGPSPTADLAPKLDEWATTLERLADLQQASEPPSDGVALNALLVQWWRQTADSYRALAEAARSGDGETWERGVSQHTDASQYQPATNDAISELKRACEFD